MAVTKTSTKARTGFAHEFDDKIKESKTTLATGGGEPIAKGHKRTTEKRVLQPRDPETGKFDYNSSAGIERKYDYHADRNGSKGKGWKNEKQVPWSFKDAIQMFAKKADIKAGQVLVTLSDKRYIASMDMKKEEFVERCETISGLNELSQGMVTKRGRQSEKEKAAYEKAQEEKKALDLWKKHKERGQLTEEEKKNRPEFSSATVSGGKYGKSTKKELKSALKDYLDGKSSRAFIESGADDTYGEGKGSKYNYADKENSSTESGYRGQAYDLNDAQDQKIAKKDPGEFKHRYEKLFAKKGVRLTDKIVKAIGNGDIKATDLLGKEFSEESKYSPNSGIRKVKDKF